METCSKCKKVITGPVNFMPKKIAGKKVWIALCQECFNKKYNK
jgi:hypothetical protein